MRSRTASLITAVALALIFLSGPGEPVAEAAALQPAIGSGTCDPFVTAIASFVFPGWGQHINHEPLRKLLVHISIGLGSTLAIIYWWGKPEGNFARLGRVAWGIYSGLDAYGACYAKRQP